MVWIQVLGLDQVGDLYVWVDVLFVVDFSDFEIEQVEEFVFVVGEVG